MVYERTKLRFPDKKFIRTEIPWDPSSIALLNNDPSKYATVIILRDFLDRTQGNVFKGKDALDAVSCKEPYGPKNKLYIHVITLFDNWYNRGHLAIP